MNLYGSYEDEAFLAEFYDHIPRYANRPDRNFFLDSCKAANGEILELGCGTGRILIPAAEAGYNITGLDLSKYMVAKCREKLGKKPKDVQDRVTLAQGNMTDFKFDHKFNLTYIAARSFQHLISTDEQMSCLKSVNEHLVKGGKLILDVFQVNLKVISDPKNTEEAEVDPEFELPDGKRLRYCGRIAGFHNAEQYNDVELIFYVTDKTGKTERYVQPFPYRYFFKYELIHLLARCGFKVIDIFGNYDYSPFEDDSPEMIFVAENI